MERPAKASAKFGSSLMACSKSGYGFQRRVVETCPCDWHNRALGQRAGKRRDFGLADDRVALFRLAKVLPEERRQFFARDQFEWRRRRSNRGRNLLPKCARRCSRRSAARSRGRDCQSDGRCLPEAWQRQRFANFASVAHGIATIRHDRHARDDLQIADL